MRRTKYIAELLAIVALIAPAAVADESSTGDRDPISARAIMQLVDARDDGENVTRAIEMILIDKKGNERKRTLRSFSRDIGEDTHTILFFESPADLKDTGLLTYDYDDDDKDDDQWLYLTSLKKTKRIASGDKSRSFVGTDFSYADLTDRKLDSYDYTLIKETEVDGVKVWEIESIPNDDDGTDENGYTKSILFVRQDNFVIIHSINWVKKGNHLKYYDVEKLEQIDGIWIPTEESMTTKKAEDTLHKTVLKSQDVRFNQEIDDGLFSVRQLEKGL